MNEVFLSYLWKYRLLHRELFTESGDPLTILHPGEQNSDGGPDFFNARLRIGDTTWAGNVEIHLRSSDWFRHGHQHDRAYDNPILHAVYEADVPVCDGNGVPFQTLVMRDRFPETVYDRYQGMMANHQWIPCYNQLLTISDHGFNLWAPALAVERLVYKAFNIRQLWEICRNDWEEAFYQHLASSFGFKINSLPFELLAKSLPLKIIRRHLDQPFQLEALFFGQSGLLNRDLSDDYPRSMLHEYRFLKEKYRLRPVPQATWKFLRLRPVNFPTLRISQWAHFIAGSHAGFFNLLENGSYADIIRSLSTCASPYWDTHYMFDKSTAFRKKNIGRDSVNLLVINGIVPFLFYYGMEKEDPLIRERAMSFLEQTEGEFNADIGRWAGLGLPTHHALQTQALLHLKRFYCDRRRCLDCRIGAALLSGPPH